MLHKFYLAVGSRHYENMHIYVLKGRAYGTEAGQALSTLCCTINTQRSGFFFGWEKI